ncbi:GntR family transcriptional regulator [Limimaricola pyoseonensis]|uniref:DNA-binding transcriptional regulator, GntR family n=1 Tax=Limimaricola pyoseonensis TaxID=521013 RepID=A0A1G7L4N7_9RHOB|nr:GntR family transcriptional regulator [Limimaricola pyoseonensis]SDF44304.1 DNA-binding transcriptional regulator, GntR family [Limimaricola pyoseonensis]
MDYAAKTETAFARLREDILNGVHAPGAPLRLSALSRRYAVSATPLREALSRLEEKRLVLARPNRGWQVAPVSLAELEDLEAARLAVEGSLLRDAIARGGLDWEAGIVAAHHRLKQTPLPVGHGEPGLHADWIAAHDGFHAALLAAAASEWLGRFHAEASAQLRRHHQALLLHPRAVRPDGPARHPEAVQERLRDALSLPRHSALMEAALARDTAAALRLLGEHVEIAVALYREIAAPASESGAAAE